MFQKSLHFDRIELVFSEREIVNADLTTSPSLEKPIGQQFSQSEASRTKAQANLPSATETLTRASPVAQTAKQTQTVTQTTAPVYEEPREMCCGDYSDHRFPYYSLNRGCCNGKTFDTLNLQCCDGVIKSIFSEC